MSLKGITYKIDVGRLIIVPLFAFVMVVTIMGIQGEIKAFGPISAIKVAKLIHHVLTGCFYLLVVFLCFIRTSPKSTTKSLVDKTVAIVASFSPFALPFIISPSDHPGILFFADLVTISGMAISLYSLWSLGRSFSIIPQARALVQKGPYKFIRHPLYAGELITMLGFVLARSSVSAWTVFFLIVLFQIYRAVREERLLAGIFPEYESNFQEKARFIPGIF